MILYFGFYHLHNLIIRLIFYDIMIYILILLYE